MLIFCCLKGLLQFKRDAEHDGAAYEVRGMHEAVGIHK